MRRLAAEPLEQRRLLAADILVSAGFAEIVDGAIEPLQLGTAIQGSASAERVITVANRGSDGLSISDVQLPSGFQLTNSSGNFVPAGEYGTFSVRLNTSAVGRFFGDVTFGTTDPDVSVFNFAIYGEVLREPAPREVTVCQRC